MKKYHLFISAHLDDAILSCGDYIDWLIQRGTKVTVATVFTGMGTELSMLARIIHKKFGLGLNTMDVRRLEDMQAANMLGANVLHLGQLESIYRKNKDGSPIYNKLQDLFITEWGEEAEVMEEIVTAMMNQINFRSYDRIYLPLGIGRHIDHFLVREAAEQCMVRSAPMTNSRLFYYEDLPYLCYNQDKQWKSELANGLSPISIMLSRTNLRAKINASLQYSSQLSLLWTSRYSMLKQMVVHAKSIHSAGLSEQVDSGAYGFRVYSTSNEKSVSLSSPVM